jgi:hypothetical protein
MPPPFDPQTFMVPFMFFELFAEEQRRRKVPLLKPGFKTTTGQWNTQSSKIASKALGLASHI